MTTPAISVVIPTRNRAQYISQSLDSVFAQTFRDYEIIVVDDGSTDETRNLLKPMINDKSIRYERQDAKGVSTARNLGIQLARAPLIAFLDSDDLFLPTKLEKQMRVFSARPELGFVHCNFAKFNNEGHNLGVRDTSRFRGRIYPGMLLEWSVLMAMPCMLMRTDILREVGGFDADMAWAEDLDLWRRIARRYEVGCVDEVLVNVRVHASSTSFDKTAGGNAFVRYWEKAQADDPGLSSVFKRRVTARMYTKLAQNLLGEGGPQQMRQARRHCQMAIKAWPLQISAIAAGLATFIPPRIRHLLLAGWRASQYPVG